MAVKQEWFSGPPPSVGWWPTGFNVRGYRGDDSVVRWWDGERWSIQFYADGHGVFEPKYAADCPSPYATTQITWQHRPASWPERSRT